MLDSMLESAIGGLIGAEVAGPVGARIGRYTAGIESMARTESANFYTQGFELLKDSADNYDYTQEDLWKADEALARYAVLYGTISGAIENVSEVAQIDYIKKAWGKKPGLVDEVIR